MGYAFVIERAVVFNPPPTTTSHFSLPLSRAELRQPPVMERYTKGCLV